MGQYPSIGRIVHYRLPVACGSDQWRAAMIVRTAASGTLCNLTVYLDQANDTRYESYMDAMQEQGMEFSGAGSFLAGVGSVKEGVEPGRWRWPPRVGS